MDHNILKNEKIFSYTIILVAMFATTQTYAWRFFGSETYTVTSSDGGSVTTYKKTYFLGFSSGSEPINVEYICDFPDQPAIIQFG